MIAAALALAAGAHRRRGDEDDPPDFRVVLGFIGGAYGLLLGLLVVFAVGRYSDARHGAENEATSLVALYDTVDVYPQATRTPYRRDLLCYMNSIVDNDWPSMQRGTSTEAPGDARVG